MLGQLRDGMAFRRTFDPMAMQLQHQQQHGVDEGGEGHPADQPGEQVASEIPSRQPQLCGVRSADQPKHQWDQRQLQGEGQAMDPQLPADHLDRLPVPGQSQARPGKAEKAPLGAAAQQKQVFRWYARIHPGMKADASQRLLHQRRE